MPQEGQIIPIRSITYCVFLLFLEALDVGATEINDDMKIACVESIASLARMVSTAEAQAAYKDENLKFGVDYLIPKPFDPRLLPVVASSVANAAIESGVATRPIDIEEYKKSLQSSVHTSAIVMRPVFEVAKASFRKIVFC